MADEKYPADRAEWLADLANEDLSGDALRNLLAVRIASDEEVERAAREVEISRRVRLLMIELQKAEIDVPADFEFRLMARIGEDAALLSLIEVYLNGFGRAMIELINLSDVPGIEEVKFQEIANAAKAGCPVSKALAGTEIHLNASLKQ